MLPEMASSIWMSKCIVRIEAIATCEKKNCVIPLRAALDEVELLIRYLDDLILRLTSRAGRRGRGCGSFKTSTGA